jgi:hypothetical protein
MDLDIFSTFLRNRDQRAHKDAQLRCSSKANSDNKTYFGLGVSRSEERGVEYRRDWNREEGYLPNLNEEISAVTQLSVGQMLDESLWLGLLMGAEA